MHAKKKKSGKRLSPQCSNNLLPLSAKQNKNSKCTRKKPSNNKYTSLFIYFYFPYVQKYCISGFLHEYTALGPVLPDSRGLVHLLSPTRQRRQGELRHPFQTSAGAAALQLRLVRPPHRRHRGDVEHVPDAVLRNLGGALDVGHRPDLSTDGAALEQRRGGGG